MSSSSSSSSNSDNSLLCPLLLGLLLGDVAALSVSFSFVSLPVAILITSLLHNFGDAMFGILGVLLGFSLRASFLYILSFYPSQNQPAPPPPTIIMRQTTNFGAKKQDWLFSMEGTHQVSCIVLCMLLVATPFFLCNKKIETNDCPVGIVYAYLLSVLGLFFCYATLPLRAKGSSEYAFSISSGIINAVYFILVIVYLSVQ